MNIKYSNKEQIFIGHLTKDDIVFKDGSTSFNNLGGAALYASAGSCLWKGNSSIISVIGKSYDYNKLIDISKRSNLDIDNIKKLNEHGLDIWVLYDKNDEHYFVNKYYSNNFDDFVPNSSMIPKQKLVPENIFHITSIPIEVQNELVNFLKYNNCTISLDPYQLACNSQYLNLWENIFNKIDIFFPSELEMNLLCGAQNIFDDFKKVIDFAKFYKIKNLVLKAGEKGAFLYIHEQKKVFHIPAISKKAIDCTGAGDAFAGGFVYRYNITHDAKEAFYYASISSSFAIECTNPSELFSIKYEHVKQRFNENNNKISEIYY